MHLPSSGFISDPAARRNRNQPGKQALRPAACEIIKAEDAQNSWICVPVRPTHSMGNQRAYSAGSLSWDVPPHHP
jgi:hypothetical protein